MTPFAHLPGKSWILQSGEFLCSVNLGQPSGLLVLPNFEFLRPNNRFVSSWSISNSSAPQEVDCSRIDLKGANRPCESQG